MTRSRDDDAVARTGADRPDTGEDLPPPGGHYRHAVRRGDLVFVAGQVGWNDDHTFPAGIVAQTRLAMRNVERALASEGATLADLATVTVYLADLGDFAAYNEVYRELIPTDPPARASIGVRLPEGCRIEITGIATVG